MSTEDAGQYYVCNRYRLLFLLSLACLLTRDVATIPGRIESNVSVDQIYKSLKEDVLLVLLYLLSDEELFRKEQVRLAVLLPFRVFHGRRLRADFESGRTSAFLSLEFRVSYASGHWQQELINVINLLSAPLHALLKIGVVTRRAGECVLNPDMQKLRERLIRSFAAQRAKTCSLWSGGPYYLAALFSSDPDQRKQCAEWSKQLFSALLDYEARLQEKDCTPELRSFDQSFLWRHSVVWREALADIFRRGGVGSKLLSLLKLVFSSHYHTKGLEDCFRFFCSPYQDDWECTRAVAANKCRLYRYHVVTVTFAVG